jgi:hypothetical protein
MNIASTRAADGLPRRAFSAEDIRRMLEAGILGEYERFELIEGDIVMLGHHPVAHDAVKMALNTAMDASGARRALVLASSTLQLAAEFRDQAL